MRKVVFFIVVAAGFVSSGCQYGPLVGVMSTPTYYERKIPAEYKLAPTKKELKENPELRVPEKVLVLVDQPTWINADFNLRYYLSETMSNYLTQRVGVGEANVVEYDDLVDFRAETEDFSLLSVSEIGEALGADTVLLIMLEEFSFEQVEDTRLHKAYLGGRAVVQDVESGERLWPVNSNSKLIKVGFDGEHRGVTTALKRLVMATSHCIGRHLYDCPKPKFKIAEDRSRTGWEKWSY